MAREAVGAEAHLRVAPILPRTTPGFTNKIDCQVPPGTVGGRLSQFADEWRRFISDAPLLSIIEEGYRILFLAKPPLRCTPPFDWCLAHSCQAQVWGQVVEDLIQKQAVEEVLDQDSPEALQPGGKNGGGLFSARNKSPDIEKPD